MAKRGSVFWEVTLTKPLGTKTVYICTKFELMSLRLYRDTNSKKEKKKNLQAVRNCCQVTATDMWSQTLSLTWSYQRLKTSWCDYTIQSLDITQWLVISNPPIIFKTTGAEKTDFDLHFTLKRWQCETELCECNMFNNQHKRLCNSIISSAYGDVRLRAVSEHSRTYFPTYNCYTCKQFVWKQ